MTPTFVARPSIPRLLLLACGGAIFILIGFWLIGAFGSPPDADDVWIGWMSIIVGGAASVAIVARMFDRDDQIVINAQGVYWKQWSDTVIPWWEITKIERGEIRRQRFLCLYLAHPEQYLSTRLPGRFSSINKSMGFGDVALSTVGTDESFEKLEEAVSAHWKPPEQGSGPLENPG